VNNVKGEQTLPLEVPTDSTPRFTVRGVPGLALWSVWDAQKDKPVRFPAFPDGVFYVRARAQGYADNLNGVDSDLALTYRLAFATMMDIRGTIRG